MVELSRYETHCMTTTPNHCLFRRRHLDTQCCFVISVQDCHMPVMDGIEATREIRRLEGEEGKKRLVIVALTASALSHEKERCLEAGMDAFLTKPVKPCDLEKVMASFL